MPNMFGTEQNTNIQFLKCRTLFIFFTHIQHNFGFKKKKMKNTNNSVHLHHFRTSSSPFSKFSSHPKSSIDVVAWRRRVAGGLIEEEEGSPEGWSKKKKRVFQVWQLHLIWRLFWVFHWLSCDCTKHFFGLWREPLIGNFGKWNMQLQTEFLLIFI